MERDDEIFKGTSFADLMHDVYHNSKKKDRQINQLISQLQPLIKNASDATIIVPLIKEYLDVAVRNDDHLVKLTAIVQRYISTSQTITGVDSLLSDGEKQQLIDIAQSTLTHELEDEIDKIEDEDREIKQKIDAAKSKLKDIDAKS
jgi:chromosome segregation ATPase|tara:strand:+ start:1039 stop:1476 length:438 start_codon:yes stop_codon:yes gene_type:complete